MKNRRTARIVLSPVLVLVGLAIIVVAGSLAATWGVFVLAGLL